MIAVIEFLAILCVSAFLFVGCFCAVVHSLKQERPNKSRHEFKEPAKPTNTHTIDLDCLSVNKGSKIDPNNSKNNFCF